MGSNSKIEWTDTTWNPLAGCTWASPGCDHCYAAVMARRLGFMAEADLAAGRDPGQKRKYMGITNKNSAGRIMFNGRVNLDPDALLEPFSWRRPRRVFVNSMSDLFHKDVPDDFILDVFRVMERTPQHTYQVLTKRPERMAEWVGQRYRNNPHIGPASNVWLGTSVENQEQADKRIPWLLKAPAAVRFLSCEPLLGPVILPWCKWCGGWGEHDCYAVGDDSPSIDWVIAGGESGPGARPMHPDWARSLRDQCAAAGVAFFFKQWGEWLPSAAPRHNVDQLIMFTDGSRVLNPSWEAMLATQGAGWIMARVGKHAAGRLLDGREWNEYPQVLR